jgi:Omp85 superfamily domain
VLIALLAMVASYAQDAASTTAAPAASRTELNFLPVVGGDSDVGVGVGVIGDLARLDPGFRPFRWRLELASVTTFKPERARGTGAGTKAFTIPYQEYFLELDLPQLTTRRRLRVVVRPSFTWMSTQKFYGVGNASPLPPESVPVRRTEYGRREAAFTVATRLEVIGRLLLRTGASYTRTGLQIPDDSILAQQRASGPERVRQLLAGPRRYGVAAARIALEYDSRDDEIVTRMGSFHQLMLRFGPRLGPDHPFEYAEVNLTLRAYRAPRRWLEVAGRLVGDILLGNPPFYELTEIDGSSAVGGGKGIRGVPGQRYYGKVKLLANIETRVQTWRGTFRGKPLALSVAAFFDSGRVWVDGKAAPELDGRGLGLKYGVGGGLRLQEGHTFVVRADVAWSPDARPIGAYFNVGEIF